MVSLEIKAKVQDVLPTFPVTGAASEAEAVLALFGAELDGVVLPSNFRAFPLELRKTLSEDEVTEVYLSALAGEW